MLNLALPSRASPAMFYSSSAPDEVIRWAAEDDSPLHNCFTWDTERAAREHNLFEARQLIKSVVVVYKEGDKPQPAYWNVSVRTSPDTTESTEEKGERYYQSAAVVAKNPVEYQAALAVMLRELSSAHKGLEQLRKIAPRGTKTKIDRATGQVKSAHDELEKLKPDD